MMLSDTATAALAACYATRGPNKGKLLAACPNRKPLAAAAWQGAMLVCNPYKASICALIFMTEEQRAIRDEVTRYFEAVSRDHMVQQDRDRATLEKLGVW